MSTLAGLESALLALYPDHVLQVTDIVIVENVVNTRDGMGNIAYTRSDGVTITVTIGGTP